MGEITHDIRRAVAGADPAGISARWRALLLDRYAAGGRAKMVARDFACSVKTADKWLSSEPVAPSAANLMRAALLFGDAAVMRVLAPGAAPAPSLAALERRLAELAALIRDIRQEVRPCPPS